MLGTLLTLLLGIVIVVIGLLLLAAETRVQVQDRAISARRLANLTTEGEDKRRGDWLARMMTAVDQPVERLLDSGVSGESERVLRQAGWLRERDDFPLLAIRIGFPVVFGAAAIAFTIWREMTVPQIILSAGIGLVGGVLAYRSWLRSRAKARRERLADQTPAMLQFLNMTLGSGVSVEQALVVLQQEGRIVTPDISQEMDLVLARMNAGEATDDALQRIFEDLEVDELDDTVAVLRQILKHGGNASKSLLNLVALIEDRQRTTMQERIAKMSAKMSVVMMLFLFPALLILVAGPSLVSLLGAMSSMGN